MRALPRVLNVCVCVRLFDQNIRAPVCTEREEANNFANLLGMWLFAYHLVRVCVRVFVYCVSSK